MSGILSGRPQPERSESPTIRHRHRHRQVSIHFDQFCFNPFLLARFASCASLSWVIGVNYKATLPQAANDELIIAMSCMNKSPVHLKQGIDWTISYCSDKKRKEKHLETKALFPLFYPFNTSQAAQHKATHEQENSEKGSETICNLGQFWTHNLSQSCNAILVLSCHSTLPGKHQRDSTKMTYLWCLWCLQSFALTPSNIENLSLRTWRRNLAYHIALFAPTAMDVWFSSAHITCFTWCFTTDIGSQY